MKKVLRILVYIVLFFPTQSLMHQNGIRYNLVNGLPDIYITSTAQKIGQTWFKNGDVWEKHLIQKFYSLLPHNNYFVVLDLGAQTGCFTLLAKYFPNSMWYAFEPIQEVVTMILQPFFIHNEFEFQ